MGSVAVWLRAVWLRAVQWLVWVGFLWLRVWGACICEGCFECAEGAVGWVGKAIYGLEYWDKSGLEPVGGHIMV